jgi:hypothetical protein
MSDEQIQAALDLENEGHSSWYLTDPIYGHFTRWIKYSKTGGLAIQTINQHESAMKRFVFEFISEPESRDSKLWPKYCG